MKLNHITVVGVGLIGGSFALAARRAGLASRITGWDLDQQNLKRAVDSGIIDAAEPGPPVDGLGKTGFTWEADLVFLAAPVGAILHFLESKPSVLKPGSLVTDAGSTKRVICSAAEALPGGVTFVGGHPMAGSHEVGLEFARADLFNGAPYAVVPTERSSEDGIRTIQELALAIGAHPVVMDAAEHDRAVALVSHAPQLVSSALALAVLKNGGAKAATVAGPGFSSSIRLAASRWSVWED
ncbi:MAG: prephenate dehydrogenase, partial [Blastocatellia bacterium]